MPSRLLVLYRIAVWGFTFKSYVQKLFLIQKKIVRVMTFNKVTEHSSHIFTRLEFIKIEDIRQFRLLSFVYYCLNRTAPVYFHDYFVSCSQLNHFNTRQTSRGDLFLERKNTFQYGTRPIEYNGARLWNMLPVPIRESSTGSAFQFESKKHCLLIHRIIQNSPQNQFSTLTY